MMGLRLLLVLLAALPLLLFSVLGAGAASLRVDICTCREEI
jgi:hypothetical protein